MSEQPRIPAGSPKGGRWTKMYHGTNTIALEGIRKTGLKPTVLNSVWMDSSRGGAQRYAEESTYDHPDAKPVVIVVNVDSELLKPSPGKSTRAKTAFYHPGSVPVDQLELPSFEIKGVK